LEFYQCSNYIFKNPISCPRLLNVAASSDSVVQTAKLAKMKQLHAVAAVLLLFPNFVLTQPMLPRSLNLQAKNLIYSPDRLLNAQTAFSLIDRMCGQVPEGSPADFTVSGAYNEETGDFKTWNEYMNMIGKYWNPQFFWATGPWHTFIGTCSLKPASARIEHGDRSEGSWVHNMSPRRRESIIDSHINIRLPGFSAQTPTVSWRSRCENVNQIADTFRDMPEIPNWLKGMWKGLEMREQSDHYHSKSILVPWGQEAMAIATTNVLVIRAQLVLNVKRWYWYYEPARSGIATGWKGMGEQWNDIYADRAWVEARGLLQQKPENLMRMGFPEWWSCVVIEENTIFRPYGGES